MKLVIQGKNIEITDAIRNHVEQKLTKATAHYQTLINKVDVGLSVENNPRIAPKQAAEVTIYLDHHSVVRAEERSENLYATIDMVTDKITRQLRKYKEKRHKEKRRDQSQASVRPTTVDAVLNSSSFDSENNTDISEVLNHQPKLPDTVVRSKYFAMPPMTVESALENLELVGHDFYMFRNIETGEINVIYERNHNGYGLLQPKANQSKDVSNQHAEAINGSERYSKRKVTT